MTAPVVPPPTPAELGPLPGPGTFVMPKTPMLGLEEVEPLPVPNSPAMMQEMPSVKMPLGTNANGLVSTTALPQHPCPVPRDATARAGYRRGAGWLYLLMACTGGAGAPASRAQE